MANILLLPYTVFVWIVASLQVLCFIVCRYFASASFLFVSCLLLQFLHLFVSFILSFCLGVLVFICLPFLLFHVFYFSGWLCFLFDSSLSSFLFLFFFLVNSSSLNFPYFLSKSVHLYVCIHAFIFSFHSKFFIVKKIVKYKKKKRPKQCPSIPLHSIFSLHFLTPFFPLHRIIRCLNFSWFSSFRL
jgi:hypothetical protein